MNLIRQALERTTDTKEAIIRVGAMDKAPGMFTRLFPGKRACIVADRNTYAAAGEYIERKMSESGIPMEKTFVFEDPELYAEWGYLEQIEEYLGQSDMIAVAVGSGVINDLCKLASHHLGRRYMAVGTAASMDGYTAYGASITFQGNKQTFDCPAPEGIIMDPAIAAAAPEELTASGYADLLAKIPAGADWIIADAAGAEKIDEFAFNLVNSGLKDALGDPDSLYHRDAGSTEKLAEGLIMSGFAMQAMQSSRPASGTEHQFSHFWDMEGLELDGRHVSHGFKVAIGTLVSTSCLEFLIRYDMKKLNVEECVRRWPSWEEMEQHIRTIFAGKPGHLERGLQESRAKYINRDELRRELGDIVRSWPELRTRISEQIIPFWKVEDSLRRIGAPHRPEMIGVSKERLRDTFRCIPFMRNRYTGIDLIYRCRLMPEVEKFLFGKGGRWEI